MEGPGQLSVALLGFLHATSDNVFKSLGMGWPNHGAATMEGRKGGLEIR